MGALVRPPMLHTGHGAAAALQLGLRPLRLRAPLVTFRALGLDGLRSCLRWGRSRLGALNVSRGARRRSW